MWTVASRCLLESSRRALIPSGEILVSCPRNNRRHSKKIRKETCISGGNDFLG